MSKVSNVQEIFGKFAVELEDGAKLFDTHEEALAAETEFLKGAEFRNEAAAFCANQGIEGKNAKSKTNILVAYFTWVAAGKPERVVEEAPVVEETVAHEDWTSKDDAATDEVATDEAGVEDDETEF